MCSISGAFNREQAFKIVQTALISTKERGKDGAGYYDGDIHTAKTPEELKESSKENILGHVLHAIVNTVSQPLKGEGVLTANCEIYNWEELAKENKIEADNDAILLLKLLDHLGIEETLKQLQGVYAFAYLKDNLLYLARDILGIKPLWYNDENGLIFCSEKKGIGKAKELNPRSILKYNLETKEITFIERDFFNISSKNNNQEQVIKELKDKLCKAISIRIPQRKFGLLFSGGLDSVIIAKLLKELNLDFTCYTAATKENAPDLLAAKAAAKQLNLQLKYKIISKEETKSYLEKVTPLIEDNNVIKVGVALPLYIASQLAKEDGNKVIFAGSGADELFAGYHRYKQDDISKVNKDCYSDILKIYERNCYRDDVITMNNNLELRVPYLDKDIVSYTLNIAPELKIKDNVEKHILRQLALSLDIPKEFSLRKKKAAQYGSGFDKVIAKLAKEENKSKSSYLEQFYEMSNLKLGALVSSGKDSIYAMHTMMQQNYKISCMLTLHSKNPDSFMFQSHGTEMARLQSQSINIPLLEKETKGEKEKELEDLRTLLKEAKEKYQIEGVITGALYSNYQRDRIENICDELALKIFSPLWHIDQEQEMRDILKKGFRFIIVKIAADGLDESWLGKEISNEDIDKLVELNKKIGINIAFEGGEAETLMIDGPVFKQKLSVKGEALMENEYTGIFQITKATLT